MLFQIKHDGPAAFCLRLTVAAAVVFVVSAAARTCLQHRGSFFPAAVSFRFRTQISGDGTLPFSELQTSIHTSQIFFFSPALQLSFSVTPALFCRCVAAKKY